MEVVEERGGGVLSWNLVTGCSLGSLWDSVTNLYTWITQYGCYKSSAMVHSQKQIQVLVFDSLTLLVRVAINGSLLDADSSHTTWFAYAFVSDLL